MKGLPEFYQGGMNWSRPQWAAKGGEYMAFNFTTLYPISPEISRKGLLYTVPIGKRFYYTESSIAAEFRGRIIVRTNQVSPLHFHHVTIEPYTTFVKQAIIPLPIFASEEIEVFLINDDIISGSPFLGIVGWQEDNNPKDLKNISKKTIIKFEKKKEKQSNLSLFEQGLFNQCSVFMMPKNEQLFLFKKSNEQISHLLHISNPFDNNKKVLKDCNLSLEQSKKFKFGQRDNPLNIISELNKL